MRSVTILTSYAHHNVPPLKSSRTRRYPLYSPHRSRRSPVRSAAAETHRSMDKQKPLLRPARRPDRRPTDPRRKGLAAPRRWLADALRGPRRAPGVVAFAGELRRAGHTVHTPDLFDGRTFGTLEEGMRHAEQIGFPDEVIRRGDQAVEGLPAGLVYAGFSLGVLPAQKLAQTRPGAQGALLFYSCVPVAAFGSAWPDGVPVQVHGMD